ncbi:MAG: glycoside hydrolase family 2 protein, partial [Coprococcus sp.]
MLYYLSENFKYPSKFEDLLYVSQILQGCAIQYGVEHWRRHRGRCMGTLYWQVNDNWPAPSWSSIDYFGRWKALHYFACRFYSPVASSIVFENDMVKLFVANEKQQEQRFSAQILVKTLDMNIVAEISSNGKIDSLSSECVLDMNLRNIREYEEMFALPEESREFPAQVFLEGRLILEDGTVYKNVETLLPYKYIDLPIPQISVSVSEYEHEYILELTSDCFAAFVELDFADADVIFSDNYFMITDKEAVAITIQKADILNGCFANADDLKKRLNIRTLADVK